jgi:hypothetical protein
MYSNARHGLMHRCSLTDSGYRPLSVSYNSKPIHFINGRITARDTIRHAFAENHYDGLPRIYHIWHERPQLFLLDSTFVLEGGQAIDGISAHTGTNHVENCDFYINDTKGSGLSAGVLRAFDGATDCKFLNNRFYCDVPLERDVRILNTFGSGARGDVENLTFSGNVVRLRYRALEKAAKADAPYTRECLITMPARATTRNATITDNQFLLDFEGDAPVNLFSLENVIGLNFSGNVCEITAGGRTAERQDVPPRLVPLSVEKSARVRAPASAEFQLPDLILARDCRSASFQHNIFKGTYRHGLRLEGKQRRVLVSGNDFADAHGQSLSAEASDNNVILGSNFT